MNEIINLPLRDQPWIKDNMMHLHKLWTISLWQIIVCFITFVFGLSFLVCLGFLLQFTPAGFGAEMGINLSGALIFCMISVWLFYKFIKHLNFIGISYQKYLQLQGWNVWILVGCACLGMFGWFCAFWLFILINNLQKDAKQHLAKNEPCFIKRDNIPHQPPFLTPFA